MLKRESFETTVKINDELHKLYPEDLRSVIEYVESTGKLGLEPAKPLKELLFEEIWKRKLQGKIAFIPSEADEFLFVSNVRVVNDFMSLAYEIVISRNSSRKAVIKNKITGDSEYIDVDFGFEEKIKDIFLKSLLY